MIATPWFCCYLEDDSEIMLISTGFGMMIISDLCLGEDFRAQHINAYSLTVHVQREESQVVPFLPGKIADLSKATQL